MLPLYFVAIFLGATLTFLLQPFVAKLILPLFGGTPSVWNTCVLFFQAALLAGYAYAHALTRALPIRRVAAIHLALLMVPLVVLPVEIGREWAPAPGMPPVAWQIWLLLVTVGAPFFMVSSTAPLLQRWFSLTGHPGARDPYFLYAASNAGSLLALLAYPAVLEPALDLPAISRMWTIGYVLLIGAVGGCAAAIWRRPADTAPAPAEVHRRSVPARTRLRWVALSFVPSSLMLSVTAYISTDVAAAPLLWVVPLALYLGTYILAFARHRPYSVARMERLLPLVAILLAIGLLARGLEPPPWLLLFLHLGGLLVSALACHGQLADLRPPATRLTEYYTWIAVGGLAGGIFNALIAPALFDGVIEYPLVLVAACMLRRPPRGAADDALPATPTALLTRDVVPAALVGLAASALTFAAPLWGLESGPEATGLILGVPAVACYLLLMRPVRFALALGALFLVGSLASGDGGEVLFVERTYYGIHRVRRDGDLLRLYHGRTLHGMQSAVATERPEPLAYYHRSGPAGSLFRAFDASHDGPARVAVIGLGVGSLAAYGRAGEDFTFYEIDPTVVGLARDSDLFNYWRDADARLEVVVGDARLELAGRVASRYDLMVLDAFSSDAIPIHLLTREALQLYRDRLAPGGVIAAHISNRFLDLEAVVQALASDAGLHALTWADLSLSQAERREGKLPSQWIVLSGNAAFMNRLAGSAPWRPPRNAGRVAVWTDRFSNLLGALRWSGASDG